MLHATAPKQNTPEVLAEQRQTGQNQTLQSQAGARSNLKDTIGKRRDIQLLENFGSSMILSSINALLTIFILSSVSEPTILGGWLCIIACTSIVRWKISKTLLQHNRGIRDFEFAVLTSLSIIAGFCWGYVAYLVPEGASRIHSDYAIFIIAGMTAAASLSFASNLKIVVGFNASAMTVLTCFYLFQNTMATSGMAVLCVLYFAMTTVLALRVNKAMTHAHINEFRAKQKKSALQSMAQKYKQAADEAAAAVSAKSKFLANMSHEIRTPMNGVLGMSELLTETKMDQEQQVYVDSIHESAQALLTIINDILDFSKVDAGKLKLCNAPFRLDDLLETLLQLVSVNAWTKNIEVILDYPATTQAGFIGDAGRIRQVLMNIIGNAIKFTKEGFVSISVSSEDNEHRKGVMINIRDTGIGIPEDKLPEIFDSFTQVDGTTAREFEGTGLGLAISKRLIEAMNGQINPSSEVGVGSSFEIFIPLEFETVSRTRSRDSVNLKSLPPLKRLVVDDLDLNRQILRKRFTNYGHHVVCARDGVEALTLLQQEEHQEKPFDIGLFDYNMPLMDGLELAEKVQTLQNYHAFPIIILSSASGISEKCHSHKVKNLQTLHKPAQTNVLVDALCNALNIKTEAQTIEKTVLSPIENPHFGKGHKVLVAEDTKTNQILIKKILQKAGFEMALAENGADAVMMFEQYKPDIVLMDWSMPIMNGLDATRKIRWYENNNQLIPTPIIGLSANAMQEQQEQGIASGMNSYLAKPVKKKALLETLQAYLKEQNHEHTPNVQPVDHNIAQ